MSNNGISKLDPDRNAREKEQTKITKLDTIRFKRILQQDIATKERIREESSDPLFKKRAEEDIEVVSKFLALLQNAPSPSNPSPSPSLASLISELKEMKKIIETLQYEQAKDRQRIAALELYFNTKNNGKRDFDLLAVELVKKLANRKRMDYKDILNTFNFKSHEEAYRLMKRTAQKFPYEVKIIQKKISHTKTKRIIVYTGDKP